MLFYAYFRQGSSSQVTLAQDIDLFGALFKYNTGLILVTLIFSSKAGYRSICNRNIIYVWQEVKEA